MADEKVLTDSGAFREAPSQPGRIVSLTPAASELICILGGTDKIVGRDDQSSFPPGLDRKPAVGSGIRKTISVERVLDLDPDVVVAGGHISPQTHEMIKSSGIPVIVVGTSCEMGALIRNIQLLSGLVHAEEKGGELVRFLERYTNLVRNRTKDIDPGDRPRVYHECAFGRYKTTASCNLG